MIAIVVLKIYYYHFDGLGSVVALSDMNKVIVETYEYDAFGKVTIRDAADDYFLDVPIDVAVFKIRQKYNFDFMLNHLPMKFKLTDLTYKICLIFHPPVKTGGGIEIGRIKFTEKKLLDHNEHFISFSSLSIVSLVSLTDSIYMILSVG